MLECRNGCDCAQRQPQCQCQCSVCCCARESHMHTDDLPLFHVNHGADPASCPSPFRSVPAPAFDRLSSSSFSSDSNNSRPWAVNTVKLSLPPGRYLFTSAALLTRLNQAVYTCKQHERQDVLYSSIHCLHICSGSTSFLLDYWSQSGCIGYADAGPYALVHRWFFATLLLVSSEQIVPNTHGSNYMYRRRSRLS